MDNERIIRVKKPRLAMKDRRTNAKEDEVTEASRGSFPASDPPSWTPLHMGDPKRVSARKKEGAP